MLRNPTLFTIRSVKTMVFVAVLAAFLSAAVLAAPKAEAKIKSDDQVQTAAEEYCGKGDDEVEKACRTGYREGYKGEQQQNRACDSPQYSNRAKNKCGDGYVKGKEEKTGDKQNRDSENGSFYGGLEGKYQCGQGDNAIKTKFNFGCLGDNAPAGTGAIMDLTFAIIRFLSFGVGIVLVISIIYAGIQYSSSEGNPEATQNAKNRVRDAVVGLIVYIFAFSFIQFLVPGGLFK